MREEDLWVNQPQSNVQDTSLQSPGCSGPTGNGQTQIQAWFDKNFEFGEKEEFKEVGHGIPSRGGSKCRRAEMKENMTFWCVAFEESGGGGEGEAQEIYQGPGYIMSIGHAEEEARTQSTVVLFLSSKIRSNKAFLLLSYRISNLRGSFNIL